MATYEENLKEYNRIMSEISGLEDKVDNLHDRRRELLSEMHDGILRECRELYLGKYVRYDTNEYMRVEGVQLSETNDLYFKCTKFKFYADGERFMTLSIEHSVHERILEDDIDEVISEQEFFDRFEKDIEELRGNLRKTTEKHN